MPTIPVQTTLSVLPQPLELPRLSADSFGAGAYQDIEQAGSATADIGDAVGLMQSDLSRAKAREAYNNYRVGMDRVMEGIQSLPAADAAKGALASFNQGADDIVAAQRDSLKKDALAAGLFQSMVDGHRAEMTARVMNFQRGAISSFEKQQAAAQLGMAARDYAREDDPAIAQEKLKEVYGLTHGLIRGFNAPQPGEAESQADGQSGGQGTIPFDLGALHAAVKTAVAPAVAQAIASRADSGDIDGALALARQKGGFLHPDVREQMINNLEEAKVNQSVSDYLNQAAHPEQVHALANRIEDPVTRGIAQEMAGGIAAARQRELDLHDAALMDAQMQKVRAAPESYVPADPLISPAQKDILNAYREKLLEEIRNGNASPTPAQP